jgi:Ser/Thr protein kinase RdoA (MazF antagonist)
MPVRARAASEVFLMKLLPDNPSLDHLRQQAKDLRAGLRDENPEVTLASAQRSLAQQYGFSDWPELKAEVDRRKDDADVAGHDHAKAIADRFGLGRVTAGMRSLSRADHLGRPWSLETEGGRWVARTTDQWIPIVDVETEVALQQAAMAAGIQLPAPVRSVAGEIIEEIDGKRWRVNVWRHSGPPLVAPVSAALTHQVGGILATLHGLQLPVDRVSPWHANRLTGDAWPSLARKANARGFSWGPALSAAVPTLKDLEAIGSHAPVPEPVLSHNTLGPGMVRRGPGGQLVVFDWEQAGGQPPSWELADALVSWAIDPTGGINRAGARALVEGYADVAGGVPTLEPAAFRGAAIGLVNYVGGLVGGALEHPDDTDLQRSVRHVLSHLWTRRSVEQLTEAVAVVA